MINWQVFSAVALRRLPLIEPQMNPIELRVQQVFSAWEVANSKLSQHEVQHLEDIRNRDDPDSEVIIKETAQDKLDAWSKEKSTFEFVKHDDRFTKTEYLFVKQKFGTDIKDQWLLPQASYDSEKDENLLDTARRALLDTVNIFNGYRIVSKIPSSVYSFKYPKKIVNLTGYHGAKVFFLKAQLDSPSVQVLENVDSAKNNNLKWQTREEAFKLAKLKYMKSFNEGLLTENRVDTQRILKKALGYAKSMSRERKQVKQ